MKLDIGCGCNKPKDWLGCDIGFYEYPEGEFIQTDINETLPYEDETFNECRAIWVMEHIRNDRKVQFMNEVSRILKVGGKFAFELPPVLDQNGNMNTEFFTDPTHNAWWMHGTFECFCKSFRDNAEAEDRDTYEKGYGITATFEKIVSSWVTPNSWYCELRKV